MMIKTTDLEKVDIIEEELYKKICVPVTRSDIKNKNVVYVYDTIVHNYVSEVDLKEALDLIMFFNTIEELLKKEIKSHLRKLKSSLEVEIAFKNNLKYYINPIGLIEHACNKYHKNRNENDFI